MTHPLKGVLLVSDVDGTFLDHYNYINPKNIEAVERFQKKGGLFALATGRSIPSAKRYAETFHINAPAILYNGSVLFDFEKDEFVWSKHLPPHAGDYVLHALERFPEIGIEVLKGREYYIIRHNRLTREHEKKEYLTFLPAKMEDVRDDMFKSLLVTEEEHMKELQDYMCSMEHQGVYYVASSENYLEMLPENTSKGTALEKLCSILGVKREHSYGIGDFYNDVDMFRRAGTGATLENAPDGVKAEAKLIFSSCSDGGLAEFIEYIEKKYERK